MNSLKKELNSYMLSICFLCSQMIERESELDNCDCGAVDANDN